MSATHPHKAEIGRSFVSFGPADSRWALSLGAPLSVARDVPAAEFSRLVLGGGGRGVSQT
jgi:hypothetical protein